MIPGITLDLRRDDIMSLRQLVTAVRGELAHIRAEHPRYCVSAVVIDEHALKMLRLEQYEKGMPLAQVRRSGPGRICGLPVIVALGNGTYRCPDCGLLHELNEMWYGGE